MCITDGNQDVSMHMTSSDIMHIQRDPITRVRVKKIWKAIHALIEKILAKSNTPQVNWSLEDCEALVNIIRVQR